MLEGIDTRPTWGLGITTCALFISGIAAHDYYTGRIGHEFKDTADQTTIDWRNKLVRAPFDEACQLAVTQFLKTGETSSVEVNMPANSQKITCTIAPPHP